jgi:hypothetical protein
LRATPSPARRSPPPVTRESSRFQRVFRGRRCYQSGDDPAVAADRITTYTLNGYAGGYNVYRAASRSGLDFEAQRELIAVVPPGESLTKNWAHGQGPNIAGLIDAINSVMTSLGGGGYQLTVKDLSDWPTY